MPITPDHVGRAYPPTPAYEVGRPAVAALAASVGDDNPAYTTGDVIAPPTFAAVVAAKAWDSLFADPELGLSLSRVVHADQTFTFARALRPGDVVSAMLRIDKVRNRGGVDWVGVVADLHTDTGEFVGSAASTFVHTAGEDA